MIAFGPICCLIIGIKALRFINLAWTNTAISCMILSETVKAGEGFETCSGMVDRIADDVHRDTVFGRKRLFL